MLENLKRLRKEAGISQQQLADIVGVSQQSINKYENHSIEPDIATLIRIADCFCVSVDELIGHSRESDFDFVPDELRLIDDYRKLSSNQKQAVRGLLTSFLKP